MKTHIHTVYECQKNYKCESCGKTFAQGGHLNMHIHTVHEDHKDYITLSSNCFEETHLYNSWRLQELQIWVMWKKLSALHHLKDQIKTVHDGRKDHKCDICNKNFALERKLKEHFKNHGWRNYTNWKM